LRGEGSLLRFLLEIFEVQCISTTHPLYPLGYPLEDTLEGMLEGILWGVGVIPTPVYFHECKSLSFNLTYSLEYNP
jgi:hypothetical protein